MNIRIVRLPDTPPDNGKWSFVIGAEIYLNTDDIIYARRSAELFALTARKVLGVPESHLITLYDGEAAGGNIKAKLKKLLDEGLSPGDTLYFYYNGHGVPNPSQGRSPYMLPTDMDLYITEEPFFDLRNLYKLFQESKAGKVNVPSTGNLAVITAGTETQFSSAWLCRFRTPQCRVTGGSNGKV